MLRILIFGILGALYLVSGSAKAEPGGQKGCVICEEYHEAVPRAPIPTNSPLFCFYFRQPEPDAVNLLVYNKAGNRINAGNERHAKVSSVEGNFCIGLHYVTDADRIILCNGRAHAVIERSGIEWLLRWNEAEKRLPRRTPPSAPILLFPTGKNDPAWNALLRAKSVPRN